MNDSKPKKGKRSKPMSKKDILKIDDSVADEVTEPVEAEPMKETATFPVKEDDNCSGGTEEEVTAVNATELSQEEIDDLRG